MQIILALILTLGSQISFGQDLMKEQIRPLNTEKKSIYTNSGTFYTRPSSGSTILNKVRNSFISSRGYERIVLDFNGKIPPQAYGHIDGQSNKVFIDLFNTNISNDVKQLKNVKFIKNIDFYTMDSDHTSVELSFVKNSNFDIFYLENPARLVIDVRK